MTERISEASPGRTARTAGVFYLLAILTGSFSLIIRGRLGSAAGLIAGAFYMALTLLLYYIFKPVNRGLSLLAASFSLAGFIIGALQLNPQGVNISMVFFCFYCLLISYLIFRSTFLPPILGALMAFAGLAWLTYVSPPLAKYLYPYNLAVGILGETSLCLWLLVMGVNVQRWKEQAGVTEAT